MTHRDRPRRRGLRLLAALVVAVGALGIAVFTAGMPSGAATAHNGKCGSGEFCYFYYAAENGSLADYTKSDSDYGTGTHCEKFIGSGRGQGACVKNNAESVWNRTTHTVTVYFNHGYGGTSQAIKAGRRADLSRALRNNNASHRIGSSGVSGDTMIHRGQVWVDHHVPYSQTRYYQGYREDCSGFVSMMWGLPKPGAVTNTLHNYGHYISKSDLRRGDVLLNPAAGNPGHVLLFSSWANSAHTKYWAYEEAGSHGAIHRVVDYPYFRGYGTFKPFRYDHLKH